MSKENEEKVVTDFLGQEINPGDWVCFHSSGQFRVGQISKLTPKGISIRHERRTWKNEVDMGFQFKYSWQVAKVDELVVSHYLLSKS